MLSTETLATIKSTAPLLAEQGKAITDLFYSKLFKQHPELQHIFNMANQAQGEQSRALAESVFMYATHIDKLQNLGPMVSRIAHKHASLQVAPEHYPIVGKYLLEAIQDHLGLESDHPVLGAWAEAYAQLAGIFIKTEEDIYSDNAMKPGGWRGFRPFVISDIRDEASGIKSVYLQAEDGQPIADFEPGQYLGIKVKVPGHEYDEIRQYSLSNAPGKNHYRITVKAESMPPNHEGKVSNFLHSAQSGDQVWVQPPTGVFTIKHSDRELVLIAGGVGITPLLSMLLHRIETGEDVSDLVFIHCCRDQAHHVMEEELRRLSAQHGFNYYVSYETSSGADHQGYLDQTVLSKWLTQPDADVYFCGPKPFMAAVNTQLLQMGIRDEQLHYEVFGPGTRLQTH
ncbi:MAG: NO-inducible flavohemoprotein [Sulfuriferula multivorans]|uniref:Flavohemoprotein n=1 Tax=Sulfuriferula multivorans TaxID=1559896 RepID=A0A7C9K2S2_9PROT|nr:NO-inducible flavohemoprotein [Sulfuriferula multivorans]